MRFLFCNPSKQETVDIYHDSSDTYTVLLVRNYPTIKRDYNTPQKWYIF